MDLVVDQVGQLQDVDEADRNRVVVRLAGAPVDVYKRQAIVKGENIPEPGIPESFKVLLKELQSLCLNVEVLSSDGVAVEMRDTDDDVYRAAEELGIDLSRRFEPSSVEEV